MESSRLLELLDSEFQLLRSAVADTPADAKVPTCPEWTVLDLAAHTAEVYLHKATAMRLGEFPKPWPPATPDLPPAEILDAAYAVLTEQFATREPADSAITWYKPEQTVGFWIRRMAQETVIHRVDAEMAAGRPVSEIAEDLALDGIDEILFRFFVFGSRIWRHEYGDLLDAPDERPLVITAGDSHWSLRATPDGFEAEETTAEAVSQGAATVSADPVTLLLWLWNRVDDDAVTLSGNEDLLAQFHKLSAAGTQ
jgi:uncharacterized protein (TIGR03083 family)